MDTTQVVNTPTGQDSYEIGTMTTVEGASRHYITRNGIELRDRYGFIRFFTSRNSARKRITRERRGDFHR